MSTIKVNKIENTSTTDGGISIDNSGHVTIDGQQLPTAGALSHRNLVLNGAMRVAQRSTSGTTTSSGAYLSVDRWKCTDGGEGAFTVSQSSTAPDGFANSVKWDCTTADTSIASEIYMEQLIEGQDLQQLGYGTSSAKSITISFWVRSNLTGEFSVWLENFDSSRYFTTSGYTINTANTWEYKTITIPGDTAGSGFGDDNGVGMKFRWHLAVRSSYQGTPSGSWSTSASNRSQSNHVNLASSTANEWYLTGVQVEVGEAATSYEHRIFSDELRSCQRYYQKSYDYVTAPGATNHEENSQLSIATSTTRLSCFVNYRVEMREDPTEIIYSPSGNSGKYANINSYADAGDASVPNNHAANTGFHQINVTGATAGNHYQFHYTADAEL